jgi:hypothetical protein
MGLGVHAIQRRKMSSKRIRDTLFRGSGSLAREYTARFEGCREKQFRAAQATGPKLETHCPITVRAAQTVDFTQATKVGLPGCRYDAWRGVWRFGQDTLQERPR